MSVLSDSEIRRRIALGELVPGGLDERATECSYSFVPGKAFLAGQAAAPIDFVATPTADVFVNPGEMIWVRTLEAVKIPHDVVGFWWQTNTLSRKGLMLVNMSMVEPGYQGDLACLFVNFGNDKIVIDSHTIVAKMVFATVSGTVAHPFTGRPKRPDYDATIRQLAVSQPSSFLQIGEISINLQQARLEALKAVQEEGNAVKAAAARELTTARAEALETFKNEDVPSALRKSYIWAGAGFIILTAALVAGDWIRANMLTDVKSVARSEAESVLQEQVTISGTPSSQERQALLQQIDALTKRIEMLEKKP